MPEGVHVAVVDPGVGGERKPLALRGGDGRLYVGPDNGLLLVAAERLGGVEEAVELASPRYRLEPVARTFHGRDIFAPAAAHLAAGRRAGGARPGRAGASSSGSSFRRRRSDAPDPGDGPLRRPLRNVQLNLTSAELRAPGSSPGPRSRSRSASSATSRSRPRRSPRFVPGTSSSTRTPTERRARHQPGSAAGCSGSPSARSSSSRRCRERPRSWLREAVRAARDAGGRRRPGLWRFFRRPLRAQFDALAPEWDGIVGPEALAPLAAALDRLDSRPARVLDLGTGTGKAARLVAERFPEAEVVGVDLSPAMVEQARRLLPAELRGAVRFEVADASALPFARRRVRPRRPART